MRRVRKQGGQPPLAAFFLITSEVESHFSGLAYWFTAINLTYRVALYNFLSTFSATLCDTNVITATYRVCPGIISFGFHTGCMFLFTLFEQTAVMGCSNF